MSLEMFLVALLLELTVLGVFGGGTYVAFRVGERQGQPPRAGEVPRDDRAASVTHATVDREHHDDRAAA